MIINSRNQAKGEIPDQVGHDEVGQAMTGLFILIHPPILLPQIQQLVKQGHPIFFHLASIQEFLIMLEPVAVLKAFFEVVAGGIAVMGFDEGLHFLVFL